MRKWYEDLLGFGVVLEALLSLFLLCGCVTKPPALSDPPVPNVCPYDIVGPCFKQSASYGGTYQLARLLAGIVF